MSNLRTFYNRLQHKVNVLSQAVHGRKLLSHHQPPAAFTGELYGLEYLYSRPVQFYLGLLKSTNKLTRGSVMQRTKDHGSDYSEDISTFAPPSDSEDEEEEENSVQEVHTSEEAVDSRGIPGWDRVDRLARALLSLSGICVTNSQAREIQTTTRDLSSTICALNFPVGVDLADQREVLMLVLTT